MTNPTQTTIISAQGQDWISADGMVLELGNFEPDPGVVDPSVGASVAYEIQDERVFWTTTDLVKTPEPEVTELSVLIEIRDLLRDLQDDAAAIRNYTSRIQ